MKIYYKGVSFHRSVVVVVFYFIFINYADGILFSSDFDAKNVIEKNEKTLRNRFSFLSWQKFDFAREIILILWNFLWESTFYHHGVLKWILIFCCCYSCCCCFSLEDLGQWGYKLNWNMIQRDEGFSFSSSCIRINICYANAMLFSINLLEGFLIIFSIYLWWLCLNGSIKID